MTDLGEYKKKIPQLKKIKRDLKERCYNVKNYLNNVKSGMLGSNRLAVREALIQDINSLKEQVERLERELKELTYNDS